MKISFIAAAPKEKINRRGLVPIVIRAYDNGRKICEVSTGKRIPLNDWDKKVLSSEPNHALLNSMITKELARLNEFILKRESFGMPISAKMIEQFMKGRSAEDFYHYAEEVLKNKTLKDGKPYSEDTKRRYTDEIMRMKQYQPALKFGQVTEQFLIDYKLWMQNDYIKKDGGRLDENSIWKALSFIQMVFKYAIDKKDVLPESNPFINFKVGSFTAHPAKTKFLEVHHLNQIEQALIDKKDLMQPMTYKVGWRFLAMCVLGLRISDAMRLNEDFLNDAGDLSFNTYKNRRHGNRAQIPVSTERQKRYLSITLNHSFPQTDPKNFRTTFNDHLKIIQAHAGITINLSSHVGRHTMGSFLVDADVKDKAFKAIFGIKSNKVIETYAHLKQDKLKSESDKLKGVM